MATEPVALAASPPPAARHGLVTVRGRDAAAFLQGQMTCDVAAIGDSAPVLAAILTPQGRVIATPWLARAPDGYDLVLPRALVRPLRERLQRFVLRSKVTLGEAEPGTRLAEQLAARVGAPPLAARGGADGYALALVRAGLPEIGPGTSEEWIPQMLNLDLLDAISFEKGCYTGQEIVARTQHLGRIKRRMFRLATPGGAPPAVRTAVLADGAKVGEVVLGATTDGAAECLAVINLEARDRPLALEDGRECRVLPLPYAVP